MTQPHPTSTASAGLEEKLALATDDFIRIKLLNELIADQVYTRPEKARHLLEKLNALFSATSSQESDFYYWLHLGNLENQEYDDEKALSSFERAVKRVDEHGDIAEKIEVYLDYLGILVNLEKMDLAREYYDRSLRLLESYSSDRLRARALCRLGYFYLHDHGFAKATPKFLETLGLLNGGTFELNTKDHYFYTLAQTGLGTLWTRPDSEEKAANAFRLAIARCEAIGMRARVPWIKLNLANVLANVEEYGEEAEAIFRSIIDSGANGSKAAMLAAYTNLGTYLNEMGKPAAEITPLLDEAETIFLKSPNPKKETLVSIEMTRAQLYLDEEDYAGAIQKLQDTLEIVEQAKDPDNLILNGYAAELCQLLAKSYADIEAYDLAYYHQRNADYYLDRHYELQDAKRQEEFAARFEAEAREKERESLQLRASQLQLRALRAQMNPHFLYNALNSIEHGLRTRPQGHIGVIFRQIPGDDDNIIATVTDDGIGRDKVSEMQANDVTRPYHQSRGTEITRSRLELLTDDPHNRVLIEDLYHDDGRAAGTRVTVRIPVADVLPRRGR